MAETNIKQALKDWLLERHQEASNSGHDDLANKINLAATHFNDCDPKTTCENYIIAKTNGDPVSASKCISLLFEPLYRPLSQKSQIASELKLTTTINQLREELSILLSELKSNNLKLKASSAPASIGTRQGPSMNPSPMLSPRVKMGSDDRLSSRDSSSKTSEAHLHSSTRIIFYNQLFENLPLTTRRSILCHFIEHSDNQFESCRLIMLGFVLMGAEFTDYANRLIKSLSELADSSKKQQPSDEKNPMQPVISNPRQLMMCRYARNLLVLDAIPLALDYIDFLSTDFNVDNLFEQVLRLYSEQCLENSSNEHELGELHEGVKKTIASKILGIEMHGGSKDPSEEHITQTLSHLSLKVIEEFIDSEYSIKLTTMRSIVTTKQNSPVTNKVQEILDLVKSMNIQAIEDRCEPSRQIATPPPKARGRPKKKQPVSQANVENEPTVPATATTTAKSDTPSKMSPIKVVFFSLVELMFNNCLSYLRSTKSRMLVNIDNRKLLAQQIEKDTKTASQQRGARSRANADVTGPSPAKQAKLSDECNKPYQIRGLSIENSPLNSELSRKMDQQVIVNLNHAKKILDFLESSEVPSLNGLWIKFKETYNLEEFYWFSRFQIDSLIIMGSHAEAIDIMQSLIDRDQIVKENEQDALNTSSSAGASDLRRLTQLLSCNVQLSHGIDSLSAIEKLISTLKSSELLTSDENYSSGNIMSEYLIQIDDNLGFLFLDTISIMRFCSDILMDICDYHINSSKLVTDTAIGHTIVLSQFDWPKEVNIYRKCIDWIRETKPKSTTPQYLSESTKFTYHEFFHYVRNPNVIEDFMALVCQSYTLDVRDTNGLVTPISSSLAPSSTGSTSSTGAGQSSTNNSPNKPGSGSRSVKAITTRGVNKTFKEDLKVAMVAQMKCSTNLISLDMISEFIRLSVLPYMKEVFVGA